MVVSNTYSVVDGIGIIPEGTTKLTKPLEEVKCSLRSIRIPKTVIDIDCGALWYCPNIEEIVVEDGNPVYDSRNGCNAVIETKSNTLVHGSKKAFIPDTVEVIGKWAFSETAIEEIHIPSPVYEIDCGAFYNCHKLINITITEGLEWIHAWAFSNCPIKEIKLPESLEELSNEVFVGCESLERLHIPRSVKAIDVYLTSGCTNLSKITVDPENKVYDSRNDCNAIIETSTNTLMVGCASTKIPKGVESITVGAFTGLDNLKWIRIPKSVVEIRDRAFRNNENLESVIILGPLKHLSKLTFDNCKGLKKIHLPIGVKKISATFDDCDLREISVPFENVEYYKSKLPDNLHKLIVERWDFEDLNSDMGVCEIVIGQITEEKRRFLIEQREMIRGYHRHFEVRVMTPEEYKERYGRAPEED